MVSCPRSSAPKPWDAWVVPAASTSRGPQTCVSLPGEQLPDMVWIDDVGSADDLFEKLLELGLLPEEIE